MQNQQMAMAANMNAGGPVIGTPVMGNGQRRSQPPMEPRDQLNTYIYDYFIRNNQPRIARLMIDSNMKIKLSSTQKASPPTANTNGVDAMDQDSKEELPAPEVPPNQMSENSFLLDWWVQFWDIYTASRGKESKGGQYTGHVRNLTHITNEVRNQRMMMVPGNGMNGMNPQAQYNMMRMQHQQQQQQQHPNGVPGDLKRTMPNRNPQAAAAMANMSQMQKQAMMGTPMQRDGSQMDGRPQSPGSNENAPSPNKRPRVDGNGMNQPNGPGQFNDFAQNAQQKPMEGINAGHQGSPAPGLDGSDQIYTGNQPRTGISNGQPGPPQGNHALQDYQMQLMLLEQQNKKRLLMARQEHETMSGPHAQGVGGPGGFPAAMSPQGSRPGPSPNPADMKKNTPRMGQQVLPAGPGGSPMPDAMMHNRNSPAPNMQFDPNAPPPGFPQQYPGLPGQMPTTPMMRPTPSSHPNFNGQPMNPQQQMEAMRPNGMQNGGWRGPQGQPGMMPTQQMGPMGNQPPQQRGQMPPPPAPAGEQQRPQVPSPSQPAQAPPTPSQTNKGIPKKKATKEAKKPAQKKGANTGATPATSGAEEPATPTTPMHKNFAPNGQQQPPQVAAQPQPPTAQQQQQQQPQQAPPMDNAQPPFGNISDEPNFDLDLTFNADPNGLDQFDFESFLHVGDDQTGFGGLDFGTSFGEVETELN